MRRPKQFLSKPPTEGEREREAREVVVLRILFGRTIFGLLDRVQDGRIRS